MSKYKRVLLKLSGEALMGNQQYGIDPVRLIEYMQQVKEIHELGVKTGIVIGGGNIFRGMKGAGDGFDRIKGDYMGMLATVINGLAFQSALESLGIKSRLLSAIGMDPIGERYSREKVREAFNNDEVVIFTAGTGNPFFTTDTAAALRAVEMDADVLLKGTRVDGVYTADPEKDPSATRYPRLSFDEAYQKGLAIMDLTAFTMCRENKMPVIVFDMNKQGNLKNVILGHEVGTLLSQ
jgi:uridylate kinase